MLKTLKFLEAVWRILGAVILGVFVIALLINIFESKPFKFESFATEEEARNYLNEHYPVGSNVNLLFDDLKKLHSSFSFFKKLSPQEKEGFVDIEYEKHYSGEFDRYLSGGHSNQWISFHPFIEYKLIVYVSADNKIVHIYLKRWRSMTASEFWRGIFLFLGCELSGGALAICEE
jgi:hypothetical protein